MCYNLDTYFRWGGIMTEKEKALMRFCSTGEGAVVRYENEEVRKKFEEMEKKIEALKEKVENGRDKDKKERAMP